jgi:hypothetical protein
MNYSDNLIFLALFIALAIRVTMHFVDKSRIKDEIEAKGGRVLSITWNPFGRGWFFEKGERHYAVTYSDRSGATISTGCKTSLFTGVYWAEGPRTEESPPRIISRHRCSACGYALNNDWRACPNCGKATEFA